MPAPQGQGESGSVRRRLEARREELERTVRSRAYALADPSDTSDPEYVDGFNLALTTAVDYGLVAIERSEDVAPPVPAALLNQARLAARNRVPLATVLRRYNAGYSVLRDCLVEELEDSGLPLAEKQQLLQSLSIPFDRLLELVGDEYEHERERRPAGDRRRMRCVEKLLAGEPVHRSLVARELAYELDAFHLGLIAEGSEAAEPLRALAERLDCRALLIEYDDMTIWAWFGARRPIHSTQTAELAQAQLRNRGVSMTIGETGQGLDGWRLSHEQAKASLPVARRKFETFVRYADVALTASLLNDPLLVTSLKKLFLDPLATERDGGVALRETLRAYFAADRNGASTATALGISRQTVTNHLRRVEELLNQPLTECAVEVEAVLRLEELEDPGLAPTSEE